MNRTAATAEVNGITIAYESLGEPAAPAILLIMGLGMQLIAWPDAFCEGLVARGYRVVRFDNRDCGESSQMAKRGMDLTLAFTLSWLGLPLNVPYSLRDMAADAVGLMDALGIERAHLVGISMGGMIAQIIAHDHPQRVSSLISVMSSTGNRAVSQGRPEAMAALTARPADARDQDCVIDTLTDAYGVLSSPAYPTPRAERRAQVARAVKRRFAPSGTKRQLLAILAAGDRRWQVRRIRVPTLVIHGADDPLVPVAAGRDTAECIPGAELLIIPGMGHDFPPGLVPQMLEHVAGFCGRSGAATGPR